MSFNKISQYSSIIPPLLGLDISGSSFKFLQLESDGKNYTPSSFGEYDLPENVVVDGAPKQPEKLTKILSEMKSKEEYDNISPFVAASIPDEEIFLRIIEVPDLPKKELDNAVRVEAERNVPIAIENAYLDYHIFFRNKKEKKAHVVIAASKRDVVETYDSILRNAGFIPIIFEPEVSAIARSAIRNEYTNQLTTIVEIGASHTRVAAFVKDSVVLTGAVDLTADELTQVLADVLGVSPEEAIKMKNESNILDDEKVEKEITKKFNPLFDNLADAVKNYNSFLQNSLPQGNKKMSNVNKILLSGGGARIPTLQKGLSLRLDVPVEVVNPWVNVLPNNLKETPEINKAESVRYTTAIGLALRGVKNSIEEFYESS